MTDFPINLFQMLEQELPLLHRGLWRCADLNVYELYEMYHDYICDVRQLTDR